MAAPDADPGALLRLGVEVASEAGELLLRGREGDLAIETKTSPTDVVTAMDTAAERLIAERIRAARPDDGLLGEEGADDAGSSGVRWVVDPLDGTVNYLYRLPFWAVSLAAEVDGQAVAAVVHAPVLQRTYTAVRGHGAWCGDRGPLRCSDVVDLGQALVATGFGYESSRRRGQARVVAALLPLVRDIRRYGSAALDLCLVAEGAVDAYFERGTHPWDRAAGALVAAEAGATVGGLAGRPASEDLALAASPGLFPALEQRLRELAADRD